MGVPESEFWKTTPWRLRVMADARAETHKPSKGRRVKTTNESILASFGLSKR